MKRSRLKPPAPPPAGDDGPEPFRTTPRRLARQIEDFAVAVAELATRRRKLGVFVRDARLRRSVEALLEVAADLSRLGADVLVGKVEIEHEFCDPAHVPERPLIDKIEAEAIGRRLTDAERERIVERGDTDPEWQAPAPRKPKGKAAAGSNGHAGAGPEKEGGAP